MIALSAGLALLALLGVFNLGLTTALARRIREQAPSAASPLQVRAAGESVGHVDLATTSGDVVHVGHGAADALVGFFTETCSACAAQLPKFLELAADRRSAGLEVVAVVSGDPADAAEYAQTKLSGIEHVVVEGPDGPATRAFGVWAFPSFCTVDASGTITSSGHAVSVDSIVAVP